MQISNFLFFQNKNGIKVTILPELRELARIIRSNWAVSLGAKSRLHVGIHWDTNGCTDSTDFTDGYRFFLFFVRNKALGLKKSVLIREICSIRTSIRIPMYPKV
jgi:hypothetical protein